MHENTKQAYKVSIDYFTEMIDHLSALRERARDCTETPELADDVYAVREVQNLVKELKTKLNELFTFLEERVCDEWMKDAMAGSRDESTIRTDYCSVTPRMQQYTSLPTYKSDPERYLELMDWLGIGKEAAQFGALRPDYNGMCELVSKRIADGEKLPPGLDPRKVYNRAAVRIRRKKGILE